MDFHAGFVGFVMTQNESGKKICAVKTIRIRVDGVLHNVKRPVKTQAEWFQGLTHLALIDICSKLEKGGLKLAISPEKGVVNGGL